MSTTNTFVQFYHGLESNLPAELTEGTIYITHNGYMYVDLTTEKGLERIGMNSVEFVGGISLLNIDYDTILAFDTNEIVIGNATSGATSAKLGSGILGYMVLGKS